MKKILIVLVLFQVLAGLNMLNAQEKIYKDKVVLKQGSVIVGAITDYVPGTSLSMELKTGNELHIMDAQIKRVIMYHEGDSKRLAALIKDKRFYNETDFAFLAGPSFLGVSLNHNVLYQYNKRLSIGAGIGVDNYKMQAGKSIFPLYANAKYNLLNHTSAPYLGMKIGYGFAFTNEEENITEAPGGFMASPYFGLRLGSRGTIINFFSGLKFQKADYLIVRSWETRREDILYRRVMLGMSVMF